MLKEKIKKGLLFLITIGMYLSNVNGAYCAIECSNNQILAASNENINQSVASISKIMSAIIVLENSDLNDYVVINDIVNKVDGSSIYLKIGDVYTVRSLLYGLLLQSGNDASMMLAYYVGGGDINHFVNLMNEKAKALGLWNTKFNNPSGLDEVNGNYSSSYDMSIIMCTVTKYPLILEIMQTNSYKSESGSVYYNKNRLLKMNNFVIGGKTGFTRIAGRTLVSAAQKLSTIAITSFRDSDDFNFHDQLYNTLFSKYKSFTLVKKGIYYDHHYLIDVKEDLILTIQSYDENNLKLTYDKNHEYLLINYTDNEFAYNYKIRVKELKT